MNFEDSQSSHGLSNNRVDNFPSKICQKQNTSERRFLTEKFLFITRPFITRAFISEPGITCTILTALKTHVIPGGTVGLRTLTDSYFYLDHIRYWNFRPFDKRRREREYNRR